MAPPPDHESQHKSETHVTEEAPVQKAISSAELLAGHQEILIRHGTETYRLRLTRAGKLILSK